MAAAGSALSDVQTRMIGRRCCSDDEHSVQNREMKLLQYQADCREVALLDRSVIVAIECFADQLLDLALHRSQVL